VQHRASPGPQFTPIEFGGHHESEAVAGGWCRYGQGNAPTLSRDLHAGSIGATQVLKARNTTLQGEAGPDRSSLMLPLVIVIAAFTVAVATLAYIAIAILQLGTDTD
jgi:hypothetical protein